MIKYLFLRSLVGSILMAIIYGIFTFYNPYVIGDAVFMLAIVGLNFFLASWMRLKSGIKSKPGLFFRMLIICFVSYIVSWAAYFQLDNGSFAFSDPGKFFAYIIHYASENQMEVSRATTSVGIGKGLVSVLYVLEFILFLVPSLNVFNPVRHKDLR